MIENAINMIIFVREKGMILLSGCPPNCGENASHERMRGRERDQSAM